MKKVFIIALVMGLIGHSLLGVASKSVNAYQSKLTNVERQIEGK